MRGWRHDGHIGYIIAASRMQRLLHQVLQPSRLRQVLRILRVDDLEEDLLNVGLVRLVLYDLTELDTVDFCGNKPLHLVE